MVYENLESSENSENSESEKLSILKACTALYILQYVYVLWKLFLCRTDCCFFGKFCQYLIPFKIRRPKIRGSEKVHHHVGCPKIKGSEWKTPLELFKFCEILITEKSLRKLKGRIGVGCPIIKGSDYQRGRKYKGSEF